MPHLVIQYTANSEDHADIGALCRKLLDTIVSIRDANGAAVFPPAGTRVMAYPAVHSAVANSQGDYAFVYLNFRIAKGRAETVVRKTGEAILEVAKHHLADHFGRGPINVTLQIDESQLEIFHGQQSNFKNYLSQTPHPVNKSTPNPEDKV